MKISKITRGKPSNGKEERVGTVSGKRNEVSARRSTRIIVMLICSQTPVLKAGRTKLAWVVLEDLAAIKAAVVLTGSQPEFAPF